MIEEGAGRKTTKDAPPGQKEEAEAEAEAAE